MALVCATLTLAGGASAAGFGANDDTGKFLSASSGAYYDAMAAASLKQNVMTIRWDPASPTALPSALLVKPAITAAQLRGIEVVFAVYPFPLAAGVGTPAAFAAWLTALATAYPEVKTFIVGNEPNLSTFWRPQWSGPTQASAASFGPYLAAGYDALKAVSSAINVLGVGLSPRGNDDPDGSPSTTSPVRWLKAFGDWYRASGRSAPLMDGFSFHPYPNPSDFSVGFEFSYQWPNGGVQDLARIKQAFVDAFRGTGQPTPSTGLKLTLDEVGWQIDTSARPEYAGAENVTVTSEANQAAIYKKLVQFVQCDPLVAQLNFFGFYDDKERGGWQAGLHWADGSPKAAAAAVKEGIAAGCAGGAPAWSASNAVDGAAVDDAKGSATGASFRPTASEDYSLTAAIYPASTSKAAIAAGTGAIGKQTSAGKAYLRPPLTLPATLADGSYVLGLTFGAWASPARTTTLVSSPFTVGTGGGGASGGLEFGSTSGVGALVGFPFVELFGQRLLDLSQIQVGPFPTLTIAVITLTNVSQGFDTFSRLPQGTTAAAKGFTLTRKATLKPGKKAKLSFPKGKLKAGTYTLKLTVTTKGRTASMTSKPFAVAAGGKVVKKPAKPAKPAKPVKNKKK